MLGRIRTVILAGGLAGGLLWVGCVGGTTLLNPEFLSSLGGGTPVANLPGDAPMLLVAVENHTQNVVEAQVSYRTTTTGAQVVTTTLEAGQRTAQALVCPIDELTLGDVSDSKVVGARILLGNAGAADAPFLEVEPFGVIMKNGVNYSCGDEVTFSIQTSTATLSGFQIFAFIRRSSGG